VPVEPGDDPRRPTAEASTVVVEQDRAWQQGLWHAGQAYSPCRADRGLACELAIEPRGCIGVGVAVRLRRLVDDEIASFVAATRADYELGILNAGLSEEEAHAKAERDFATLVRDGRPVAGQELFVIEDAETGAPMGRVWLGERFTGQRIGFLYDIEIDERFRGRGLGREAMLLVEEEARRRGFVEIRLNVFGGNETAHSLYRSLSYVEFTIGMRKRLT
jgi:ribosomal protein S18 acetylase RimI-like enzyme